MLVDRITFEQVQDEDNLHRLLYRNGDFYNTQVLEDARVLAAPLAMELSALI